MRKLFFRIFLVFEKYLRLHILPVHFYSPIPSTEDISQHDGQKERECKGLNFHEERQLAWAENELCAMHREFEPYSNKGLSKLDSLLLYAFIRTSRPKKMIEIGSGQSTLIALKAIRKNVEEGYPCDFTAIEPYPAEFLTNIKDDFFTLLKSKVQNVPVSAFGDVDLLFIDSSHVSKYGSDVNYEILEILPSIKVGAYIHWHDILIPYDYPSFWLKRGYFWTESYLLESFLSFNNSFEIQWASKYMQMKYADDLSRLFSFVDLNDLMEQNSSFWIRRTN